MFTVEYVSGSIYLDPYNKYYILIVCLHYHNVATIHKYLLHKEAYFKARKHVLMPKLIDV